jgi:hypothetical protein
MYTFTPLLVSFYVLVLRSAPVVEFKFNRKDGGSEEIKL